MQRVQGLLNQPELIKDIRPRGSKRPWMDFCTAPRLEAKSAFREYVGIVYLVAIPADSNDGEPQDSDRIHGQPLRINDHIL